MVKFKNLHEVPVFLAATKIPFSFTNSVPRNLAFLNLFRFHFSGSAAVQKIKHSENDLNGSIARMRTNHPWWQDFHDSVNFLYPL
jgi:hypothetical protein